MPAVGTRSGRANVSNRGKLLHLRTVKHHWHKNELVIAMLGVGRKVSNIRALKTPEPTFNFFQ